MTTSAVRVGVGTHFAYDGEVVEVVELIATLAGNEVREANAPLTILASRRSFRASGGLNWSIAASPQLLEQPRAGQ